MLINYSISKLGTIMAVDVIVYRTQVLWLKLGACSVTEHTYCLSIQTKLMVSIASQPAVLTMVVVWLPQEVRMLTVPVFYMRRKLITLH